jgi:hypothetical protein
VIGQRVPPRSQQVEWKRPPTGARAARSL